LAGKDALIGIKKQNLSNKFKEGITMKKGLVFGLFFLVLVVGSVSNALASTNYIFVNETDADIAVEAYTQVFFCANHHSPLIPPGGRWECDTKCAKSIVFIICYGGNRYPLRQHFEGTNRINVYKGRDGQLYIMSN
jgi:hypothetical protein